MTGAENTAENTAESSAENTAVTSADVPLIDTDLVGVQRPLGTSHEVFDELRERSAAFQGEGASRFWVLTRHEAILEAYQSPDLFSSRAITLMEPDPPYQWIPVMVDPPQHTMWRRLLRPLFTPATAAAMRERTESHCVKLIEDLAARGSCDFVADFARVYPTTIFLELMGLPPERLGEFLEWEHAILHTPASADRPAIRQAAVGQVMACFSELIAVRRRDPRDDIVTAALSFEIDGRRVTDEELLSLFLLLFIAGLDTVTAALSYGFWHLAGNPGDRARITEDPGIVPSAVEELLRAYAIALPGRRVTRDVDFHGCAMKAGDMVLLPLPAATRDPRAFPDPLTVDFDRSPNRHIAFGAGPHRCLGAHLARMEMQIALREWHARIPGYRVAGDAVVSEHAGVVLGLDTLPLLWT